MRSAPKPSSPEPGEGIDGSSRGIDILVVVADGHVLQDRKRILAILTDGYRLPDAAAHALLSTAVPFSLEGEPGNETVVFTVDDHTA